MKVTVNRKALQYIVGQAKVICPNKAYHKNVTHVLLKAENKKLVAMATNLAMWLTTSCEATITKKGAIAVETSQLNELLKAIHEDEVRLVLKKKTLEIQAGRKTAMLSGITEGEFYPMFQMKGQDLQISGLKSALNEVEFAQAKDESRPPLCGILFDFDGGQMVAADGFMMAIAKIPSPTKKGTLARWAAKKKMVHSLILPKECVKSLQSLFGDDPLTMQVPAQAIEDEKQLLRVSFRTGSLSVVCCTIDGNYPDYKQLIPANRKKVVFEQTDMKEALHYLWSAKPANKVVRIATAKGEMRLSATREGDEAVKTAIPVKGKIKIGMNIEHMRKIINQLNGQVVLTWDTKERPYKLTQNGSTYVVMPMFIPN